MNFRPSSLAGKPGEANRLRMELSDEGLCGHVQGVL
jgi:hypothetical protein